MIKKTNSLPRFLVDRYKIWKKTYYFKNQHNFKKLSKLPQKPKAMIISCCDSRINPTSIFGAKEGELFIHRNIANIIPPYNSTNIDNSTFAAIEYAIKKLKVPNLIILGHTNCGGIKAIYDQHFKGAKNNYKFVNRWLKNISAVFLKLPKKLSKKNQIIFLEEEGVKVSINNLLNYPNIKNLVTKKKLLISGLIFDISSGDIKSLNSSNNKFEKI